MDIESPLVASASPLKQDIGNIRRLEDAGAAAVVMHSLFEEQILIESRELDRYLSQGSESYGEALEYFPDLPSYEIGPEAYLELIRKAREAVSIPVIGSLNGCTPSGWVEYAKQIEQAGAHAIELNVYFLATDPGMSALDVENKYVDLLREVKARVRIPVAIKLGPYFSAFASLAHRLDAAGADALVLFNRFYQPDFDLEYLEVTPNLQLSSSQELRLRLRWAAVLYSHIRAEIAITGGVHEFTDVLKAVMAGANVAMMTSAVLRHGFGHFTRLRREMHDWLEANDYESINQMRGSMSMKGIGDPAAFERANYLKVLSSYSTRA
jgi:dihydroorotate dehydrogenase (fumarate)